MEAAKKSVMEPDSKERTGRGSKKNSGQAHENVSGSAIVDGSTVVETEDALLEQGARETQGTMSRRNGSQHKSLSEEAVKQNQEAAEKRDRATAANARVTVRLSPRKAAASTRQ